MKTFHVLFWVGHPELESSECPVGLELETAQEAREVANEWEANIPLDLLPQTTHIEIDGPHFYEVIPTGIRNRKNIWN